MSEIPDIEVARYALRTFNVKDRRLMPVAMPVEDAWKGGVCQAECVPNPWTMTVSALASWVVVTGDDVAAPDPNHAAPAEGCHCGIYGCLTIDRLVKQYPLQCMEIVAVIAVEGNTIIGEIGLRTQAARIVAYWSPKRKVRKICADTCDGAIGFAKLDDMLAAYGFEPAGASEPRDDLLRLSTRLSRIAFWITVACVVVNLAFFTAGLFMSAEMSDQLLLFSLGAAAVCTGSAVLQRRQWRKAGAA